MKYVSTLSTVCLAALLAAGCSSNQYPQPYYSSANITPVTASNVTGQPNVAGVQGVIVSERPVSTSGSGGIGALAGAAAGGFGASKAFHNQHKDKHAAETAAGAIAGAVLGAMAEKAMTKEAGTEYAVRTANGDVVNVAQKTDPALQINERVLIVYAGDNQPHLIADTTPVAAAAPAPAAASANTSRDDDNDDDSYRHHHRHHHHHYHDDDDDDN